LAEPLTSFAQEVVLEARQLSRSLGAVPQAVLRQTCLQVRRGEFVALTGPSGSGKSTLLYLLGVLDKPTSGSVHVEGVDTTLLPEDGRAKLRGERLGFVFQFHFLLPEFTVQENVALPMLRRGIAAAEVKRRTLAALARLDLGAFANRLPSQLSGGQQQRVSIARAVAGCPAILLADEPTGNLDSKNGEGVMRFFEDLNRQDRMTIVFVTHDAAFARRATRQIAMKDGVIV